MALTYTQLKTAIKNFLEEDYTEFDDSIDTIIDLAELRCHREADLTEWRKSSTMSITAATYTATAPTDMVVPRWLQVDSDASMLLQKDESFIKELGTATGTPRFYAYEDDGTSILFWPSPSGTTTINIGYTYRTTGLSDSSTTSWLGDNAPDLLLYACFIEAANFMKAPPVDFNKYSNLYDRALQTLRVEQEVRKRGDHYRGGDSPLGGASPQLAVQYDARNAEAGVQ
jgi:hypothetical protein